MTSFTGLYAQSIISFGTTGGANPEIGPSVVNSGGSALPGQVSLGSRAVNQPVSEAARQRLGSFQASINDFFYNRIIIEPSALDVGNLVSSQVRDVRVWNAYPSSSKPVASFNIVNPEGVGVVQPDTAPFTLKPLQEVTYVVSVTTNGPPIIDSALQWSIAGKTYAVQIVGKRLVLFPIEPDWSSPFVESLEWRTDVLRSFNGTEQRRALRRLPRRSFEYNFSVKRDAARKLNNLLLGWQNRVYAMPMWQEKNALTADAALGSQVLSIDTDSFGYAAGQIAVIYVSHSENETVEIDSFTANTVTLKRPTTRYWPKGTLFYPAAVAHLPTEVQTRRLTDTVIQGAVTFTSSPEQTDPFLPAATAPETFDGFEVISRQPNWIDGIDNTYSYLFDEIDASLGPILWETREKSGSISRPYAFFLRNRQDMVNFRAFLRRMEGRLKTCLIPSWHDDMVLRSTIGSGDTGMYVVGSDLGLMLADDQTMRRLMIRLKDGTTFYRKVLSVQVDNNDTFIQLGQSLSRIVAPSDVQGIHMLLLCRLSGDKVEIPWRTPTVADPTINFTTVSA